MGRRNFQWGGGTSTRGIPPAGEQHTVFRRPEGSDTDLSYDVVAASSSPTFVAETPTQIPTTSQIYLGEITSPVQLHLPSVEGEETVSRVVEYVDSQLSLSRTGTTSPALNPISPCIAGSTGAQLSMGVLELAGGHNGCPGYSSSHSVSLLSPTPHLVFPLLPRSFRLSSGLLVELDGCVKSSPPHPLPISGTALDGGESLVHCGSLPAHPHFMSLPQVQGRGRGIYQVLYLRHALALELQDPFGDPRFAPIHFQGISWYLAALALALVWSSHHLIHRPALLPPCQGHPIWKERNHNHNTLGRVRNPGSPQCSRKVGKRNHNFQGRRTNTGIKQWRAPMGTDSRI